MREILKELDVIAVREDKTRSELVCDIIKDYVTAHSEGNNTFKLDNWQEDPEFKALPTLMSSKEKWSKYILECPDSECTDIGIMSSHIFGMVKDRRNKEYRNNQKTPKFSTTFGKI